jgi:peroxiredoxin
MAFAVFAWHGITSSAWADTAKSAALENWKAENKPAFALRDIDGRELQLASLRGRIVFLHFFATWCEPCREELPALQRLAERGKSQRASIVTISVAEVPDRVRRFLDKEKLSFNFPLLLDEDRSTAKTWGVQILPSTIVLDTKLTPRLIVESDYAWDNLDLGRLLARLSKPPSLKNEKIVTTQQTN